MSRQKIKRRYNDRIGSIMKQPIYYRNNKGGFGKTWMKWDMSDMTIITKEEYEKLEAETLEKIFGKAMEPSFMTPEQEHISAKLPH